jgi:hypothetical protein
VPGWKNLSNLCLSPNECCEKMGAACKVRWVPKNHRALRLVNGQIPSMSHRNAQHDRCNQTKPNKTYNKTKSKSNKSKKVFKVLQSSCFF